MPSPGSQLGTRPRLFGTSMLARMSRRIGDSNTGRSTLRAKYWLHPSQTAPRGSTWFVLPMDSGTIYSTERLVSDSALQRMQRMWERLTFDMRGGRKWAKPACGRRLDG